VQQHVARRDQVNVRGGVVVVVVAAVVVDAADRDSAGSRLALADGSGRSRPSGLQKPASTVNKPATATRSRHCMRVV
jgi:hypothetical protein